MQKGHRIERFEEVDAFLERMKDFNEADVECTLHTLFRLSEKQRRIFTCEELKRFLLRDTPLKVGVQYEGNYALYYDYKEKALVIKIIASFKLTSARIITFYFIDKGELPK